MLALTNLKLAWAALHRHSLCDCQHQKFLVGNKKVSIILGWPSLTVIKSYGHGNGDFSMIITLDST